MKLRERTNEDRTMQAGDSAGGNSDGANLDRIRASGQSLLAAGADVIQRALSGDSETFLAATRQQGGQ